MVVVQKVGRDLFSAKFETEAQLLASLKGTTRMKVDTRLQALSERLESLRALSSRLTSVEEIIAEPESRLVKIVGGQPKEEMATLVKGVLPGGKKRKEEIEAKKKKRGFKMVTPLRQKRVKRR